MKIDEERNGVRLNFQVSTQRYVMIGMPFPVLLTGSAHNFKRLGSSFYLPHAIDNVFPRRKR